MRAKLSPFRSYVAFSHIGIGKWQCAIGFAKYKYLALKCDSCRCLKSHIENSKASKKCVFIVLLNGITSLAMLCAHIGLYEYSSDAGRQFSHLWKLVKFPAQNVWHHFRCGLTELLTDSSSSERPIFVFFCVVIFALWSIDHWTDRCASQFLSLTHSMHYAHRQYVRSHTTTGDGL